MNVMVITLPQGAAIRVPSSWTAWTWGELTFLRDGDGNLWARAIDDADADGWQPITGREEWL